MIVKTLLLLINALWIFQIDRFLFILKPNTEVTIISKFTFEYKLDKTNLSLIFTNNWNVILKSVVCRWSYLYLRGLNPNWTQSNLEKVLMKRICSETRGIYIYYIEIILAPHPAHHFFLPYMQSILNSEKI